ncbi:hypothetical protein DMENIID0001_106340 [Sergentomyia squamirostris]
MVRYRDDSPLCLFCSAARYRANSECWVDEHEFALASSAKHIITMMLQLKESYAVMWSCVCSISSSKHSHAERGGREVWLKARLSGIKCLYLLATSQWKKQARRISFSALYNIT